MEQKLKALMADDDVTNKKGVYSYVLTNDEKYLANALPRLQLQKKRRII